MAKGMKKTDYREDAQKPDEKMVANEPAMPMGIAATTMTQLPLQSIWALLHDLDTTSKLWLIDHLSKDVHKQHDITQTAHYKAAMEDVEAGRVTEWKSVDEMFASLGL